MTERLNINALEQWYKKHARKLPFRETKNPYNIWVSEIMLQQTKMDTVLPYYQKFMNAYPTVESLANTTQEALLKLLEGIGYYRRFKHMLLAAKTIVETYHGFFPKDYTSVRSLSGVGEYTAGAIMSIAYNQPFAATDGNVVRVLSRVYQITNDMRLEKHKKQIHALNQSLIEKATPRIYTEALMELGALICLPRNPMCTQCPLKHICLANIKHLQDDLPIISQKPKKKLIGYITLVIHAKQAIYLRKRTEKLLEGMFEFPQFEGNRFEEAKQQLLKQGIHIALQKKGGVYQHIFTHIKWNMHVYHVRLVGEPAPDWICIPSNEMKQYPMAKAHRQITLEVEKG